MAFDVHGDADGLEAKVGLLSSYDGSYVLVYKGDIYCESQCRCSQPQATIYFSQEEAESMLPAVNDDYKDYGWSFEVAQITPEFLERYKENINQKPVMR